MPRRVGYSSEDKVTGVFDTDQFRGLEKGERRRVCLMEKDMVMAVVHWVNGSGYCECLGDYNIVSKGELDGENCPACRHASDAQGSSIGMPQRKFVVYILEYITNTKGAVLSPLNFRLKAWVFGNDKHSMLVDRAEEFGDLRKRDLIVTCNDKKWQRYDIVPTAKKTLWLQSGDDIKARAITLFKEERRADIGRLLGKTLTVDELRAAVDKAIPSATVVDDDIEGILEEGDVVSAEDVEELLAVTLEEETEASEEQSVVTKAQPTKAATKATKQEGEDAVLDEVAEDVGAPVTDFDDLLADLED